MYCSVTPRPPTTFQPLGSTRISSIFPRSRRRRWTSWCVCCWRSRTKRSWTLGCPWKVSAARKLVRRHSLPRSQASLLAVPRSSEKEVPPLVVGLSATAAAAAAAAAGVVGPFLMPSSSSSLLLCRRRHPSVFPSPLSGVYVGHCFSDYLNRSTNDPKLTATSS